MAKNKSRTGAVDKRSQLKNPVTQNWQKRNADTGKFINVKADKKPFKGVRKES